MNQVFLPFSSMSDNLKTRGYATKKQKIVCSNHNTS